LRTPAPAQLEKAAALLAATGVFVRVTGGLDVGHPLHVEAEVSSRWTAGILAVSMRPMLESVRWARRPALWAGIALVAVITFGGAARADLPRPKPPPVVPPPASAAVAPAPAPTRSVNTAAAPSSSAAAPAASAAPAPVFDTGEWPQASAQPAPSASAPPPVAPPNDLCASDVNAWAKAASASTGLDITAVSCVSGVVRLEVADAGCDYEVTRGEAFQRTADRALGVSPIVNVDDWSKAPEPMRKGLAGVLSALNHDASLQVPKGQKIYNGIEQDVRRRRNRIIGGVAGAVAAAALIGVWLKRRKATSVTPAAPPPAT
jgi:hypothetical protein